MKSESEIRAILEALRQKMHEIDDQIYSLEDDCYDHIIINLKYESAKIEGQIHALRWVLQSSGL